MPPRERIRGMFGAIAGRYDRLNHMLSLQVDRLWRRRTVRRAGALQGRRALDVCAGTGDLSFQLARAGARVVGSDFTPQMISLAEQKRRARLGGNGHPLPSFLVADTLTLPFPSDGFDVVTVAFGIRNVEDVEAGLREMTRVVRPGGKVLVLEFSRPPGRIFRPLYLFYFRQVLPRIGAFMARQGGTEAYRYLPESVMGFPDPEELAQHMRRAGLEKVGFERLTRGIATLHCGQKPESAEEAGRD